MLIYLLNVLDNECLVKITQKEVSEKLKINLSIVNTNFKKLIEMEILEKIKNGIYMLLI
ncbi:MAG: replication/maintenance protein RepL [Clostridia bacterium]